MLLFQEKIKCFSIYFSCMLYDSLLFLYFALQSFKAWPNWTTLFANMSIIILVECSWTFDAVDRSGQSGQHRSPTNSIRHKLNAIYVALTAV